MPSSDFKLLKKRSVGALCPKRFAGQALPAVTASAHALLDAITPQSLAILFAGVMTPLIRMKHDAFRFAS